MIGRKTGLGGLWIGAVLLAIATSLPEVVSGVSAAAIGAPDLTTGDVLGSGMFNMFILAVTDLVFFRLHRARAILRKVALSHALTATLAMLLTGLAALFIILRVRAHILQIGLDTILIVVVYLLGMWLLFREQKRKVIKMPFQEAAAKVVPPEEREITLGASLIGLVAGALVIAVAAPFLVSSAQQIAVTTGLGATFVGTFFLAGVTSFPELVVALSAVRIGALDLAVGNLFGSNAFNIVILFLADIAFRRGPILSAVSSAHVVTALFVVLLMGIGLMGILARRKKRYLLLVPDSLLIALVYLGGLYTLFILSARR